MAEIVKPSRQQEYTLHKEAETFMIKENHVYQEKCEKQDHQSKDMDFRWIRTMLSKGTLADKIAANTLMIQDSPKNNLACLEMLITMINPKAKREALMAVDAVKELFISDLLKEHKLRPFNEMLDGLDNLPFKKRRDRLVEAYVEDQLRQMYRRFVESVEQFTHDPESITKSKAIKTMFELLIANSEQEQFLLEKLVNKLGDPDPRSCSLVVQLLGRLTNEHHPAMKEVVVKEVERVLYRTNISPKAQYSALCFLSAIKYVRGEFDVANRVVKVFLGFFRACIKKQAVNSRTMAIILQGLSRAHPYTNLEVAFLQDQLDTVYKVAHMVNFNVAIQAYAVIFAVITKDQSGYLGDRYSSALYRSLLEPNLDQCSRKAVYLNLLYKSLKADSVNKRVWAFVKRFLQICFNQPANITTGVLMLISSVFKDKPDLRKEFVNNFNKLAIENPLLRADDEDEEEHFVDQDDEEEDQQKPQRIIKKKNNKKGSESDDSDDSEEEEEEEKEDEKKKVTTSAVKNQKNQMTTTTMTTSGPASSWLHSRNLSKEKGKLQYDPLHRNPLYANADQVKPFELCVLRNHFHPTVSHFTENLVHSKKVEYDGDALYDFNVKSFLDKFVYKNPKKVTKSEKKECREQVVFERNRRHHAQRIQINGPGYVNQAETGVPVEERFIYHFLKNKSKYGGDGDEDGRQSISSDDFNQLVLNRFEKSFDNELSADILAGRKRKRRDSQDDDDDDLDLMGDDEDLEIDFEGDAEYTNALKPYVDELNLDNIQTPLDEAGDGLEIDDELSEDDDEEEGDEDEDDDNEDTGKSGGKNKRDRGLMDLLASADEFAHLLEENEDMEEGDTMEDVGTKNAGTGDDDDDDDEDDEDALDFDDDEATLAKRKSKSQSRKEKTDKDAKIQESRNKKKQKILDEQQREGKGKKPISGKKFAQGRPDQGRPGQGAKKSFKGKKFGSKPATGSGSKFNQQKRPGSKGKKQRTRR